MIVNICKDDVFFRGPYGIEPPARRWPVNGLGR